MLHTFESVQVTSQGDIRIKRYNALNALERLARIDKRYTERLIQMDAKVLNTIIDALPPECRENVVMALQTMFPGGEEKPEEEFEDNGVGDEPNEYLLN